MLIRSRQLRDDSIFPSLKMRGQGAPCYSPAPPQLPEKAGGWDRACSERLNGRPGTQSRALPCQVDREDMAQFRPQEEASRGGPLWKPWILGVGLSRRGRILWLTVPLATSPSSWSYSGVFPCHFLLSYHPPNSHTYALLIASFGGRKSLRRNEV